MTDKRLLELLRTDKNAGMAVLIEQYSGFVFAIVKDRLAGACDTSEIEDCAADVFIKFGFGLDGYKGDASIKTYLGKIARNASLNYLRNKSPSFSVDADDFLIEIPDGSDLERDTAEKDLLERIFVEINTFGKLDSEILFRKYYLGQSSRHIANLLKITVSAVDTRAHRAIQKLKAKFKGEIL